MSEHLKNNGTSSAKFENLVENTEAMRKNAEKIAENAREAIKKQREADPHRLAQEAKQHAAESKKHLLKAERQPEDNSSTLGVAQAIKDKAYQRELTSVRKHLGKPSRAFSKIAHNKTVEKISEAGAKTIARPSGILGGSILAFLGSSIFLWMTKHYGFRYNFSVMILLFIGGFFLGAFIEMTIWLIRGKSRS